MDFKNANELLDLCKKHDLPISEVMRQREIVEGEKEADTVHDAMARVLEIMKNAAFTPIKEPVRSMGGLIGGEAKKIASRYHSGIGICGDLLEKSMIYAMATLETNASMGLIVASPTAGSAGIVPGLLLGLQEVHKLDDEQIIQALFNASAIGYLAMRNATVAGAVGGCQAEVGVASAMAASATVELLGGNPEQCLGAASTVLMNMLGLVCDPVGGLVEYPCQNRNAAGVANAIILPTVMEYNAEATGEKYREIARAMGVAGVDDMTQEEYRKAAIDAVRQLSQDVGIPADLKDIVKPEDIPFLAQSAYDDACRPGNPKETSVEDITKLYESLI